MKINQNEFSTFDLGLATVLITVGYKLIRMEKSNPKKVKFVFEKDKDIERTIEDFWNDELKVRAQTLLNNQKVLKNRIYSNV